MAIKRIFIVLLSLALLGCTTLRQIEPVTFETASRDLRPGEVVTIIEHGRKAFEVKVVDIAELGLHVIYNRESKFFPYSTIQRIELREVSAGKTAGAGVFGLLATAFLVVWLGAELMDDLAGD